MVLFENSLQNEKNRILLVDEQHTEELFLRTYFVRLTVLISS